jgi:hypothetical protein
MGAGFYSQCTNNSGAPFNGTTTNEQCMYHVGDLASLPTGNSSVYIEMKDSGSCFFKAGFFIEGFALQGTAKGEYNFLVGLGSATAYLSESSPWRRTKLVNGDYTFYVWALADGIQPTIQSFYFCDGKLCIGWTVPGASDGMASDAAPPSAPFTLEIPEDGSDYQGPPSVP